MNDPSFADWILHFSSTAEEYILALMDSLWIYPGVFALTVIDGFFPVVPSESIIIATTSAWVHDGQPMIWLIWICAAVGAWAGDQIAYLLGAKLDVRKFRIFRTPRGKRSLDWAEHALEKRGATFIVAARFVPMGRFAVNVGAGALRYPHRRFMGMDAIGAVLWATYSILIGWFFGALFEDNLLLSIIIGLIGGVALGVLVEKILNKLGITEPELPDLASDIASLQTPEQRAKAEQLEREKAARREAREARREERRGGTDGEGDVEHGHDLDASDAANDTDDADHPSDRRDGA
ncbi:DedA family protein [Demequina globuliformis]|uniref:DedA family protein n=1 Tax=Demequina globuliformis TaxID=676202 RepID=UPI00078478AB|nr:DedA family protein [Demequina globuliformis]